MLFLFALCGLTTPSEARRDDLRVVDKVSIITLDPAQTTARLPFILYHNWGDTLLYRHPKSQELVPCLAESYRFIDPCTLEFSLRKGVRFHNGEPFDAASVKFSVDLLRDPKTTVSGFLTNLREVKVVDDHTVRFSFAQPQASSLEIFANTVFVYPPKYYREVGQEGFGKRPVGTGPYRFVGWENTSEVVFEINPDYGVGAKGRPKIPRLIVMMVSEDLPRMEALVSGKVDLVRTGTVYPDQVPFLETNMNLKIKSTETLRSNFLIMDALGRSGSGHFKDIRVRQAVNHAIQKQDLLKDALGRLGKVSDSVCCPLHFGFEPNVTRYPYDPIKARQLLTEAGYPNGFETELYAFGSESVTEAISEYLRAVGIRTTLRWMGGEWDSLYQRLVAGKVPFALINWGSYAIFDASALLDRFFMFNDPLCYGSTQEVSTLVQEARVHSDKKTRQDLYSRSQKIISEKAFWAPLYCSTALSVMNKDLNFDPSPDGIDRYYDASWKE